MPSLHWCVLSFFLGNNPLLSSQIPDLREKLFQGVLKAKQSRSMRTSSGSMWKSSSWMEPKPELAGWSFLWKEKKVLLSLRIEMCTEPFQFNDFSNPQMFRGSRNKLLKGPRRLILGWSGVVTCKQIGPTVPADWVSMQPIQFLDTAGRQERVSAGRNAVATCHSVFGFLELYVQWIVPTGQLNSGKVEI